MIMEEIGIHHDGKQFDSAVKLVSNLPKDGSFTPSNALKLKFYALFKQATVGSCQDTKPAFWDTVKRAKWEAWNSLGNMNQEDARSAYIELLREVVGTMSYSDDVQQFLQSLEEPVVVDELIEVVLTEHKYCPNGSVKKEHNKMNGTVNGLDNVSPLKNGKIPNGNCLPNGEAKQHKIASRTKSLNSEEEEIFDDAPEEKTTPISPLVKTNFNNVHQSEEKLIINDPPLILTEKHQIPILICPDKSAQCNFPLSENGFGSCTDNPKKKSVKKLSKLCGNKLRTLNDSLYNEIEAKTKNKGFSRKSILDDTASNDVLFVKAWENSSKDLKKKNNDKIELDHREKKLLARWNPGKQAANNVKAKKLKEARGLQQPSATGSGGDAFLGEIPIGRIQVQNIAAANQDSAEIVNLNSRESSSPSESSSHEDSSASSSIEWDPQIGRVLLKMNKQLERISRQLDLMENVLINQHRLMAVLSKRNYVDEILKMPWTTAAFIFIWPVIANFACRLMWNKIYGRKR